MCIFGSCEKCLIIQGQPTPLASRCAGNSGAPAAVSPFPVVVGVSEMIYCKRH